ncbi:MULTISPECIES: response regulator transcription factor [unclassified Paenibacillus]|uniref:winged helix-turn-helix domain-containing protein n=1 Tax=unclassified Paenibacillus TaxID=185978 RepID=UPI001AEA63E8|nr:MULTISPECIES: response regulator transcription factor [unclassified Paenibacillus]MBP1153429.1 two-component system alkaline phosphatase synthesis response regulator PhoP [Paenibacillus sp. PvP091]MBP1171188.1 two-component system alkaline phosphatase synthesis response regulator PhoP [Paenibacillus sp. PvR098]MBP2442216.1 two-component system alkaline phosphatase synthesis response regulator PhoP [Paenibacillus sp. PvP052]
MRAAQGVKPSPNLVNTNQSGLRQEDSWNPGITGSVCDRTQRVIVISPFPNRLGELIGRLTSECFDVLVFHRYDPQMMKELSVNSVVYDLTASQEVERDAQHAISLFSHPYRQPRLLFLVDGEPEAGEALVSAAEFISWPVKDIAEIVRHISQGAPESDVGAGAAVSFGQFAYKDLTIDSRKMSAYRGQARLDLTKTEYELLLLLLQSEGAVLSREDILNQVWGSLYFGGSNVVDVHVKSLRKKLGDSAGVARYISTVRGVGYRLADE